MLSSAILNAFWIENRDSTQVSLDKSLLLMLFDLSVELLGELQHSTRAIGSPRAWLRRERICYFQNVKNVR